MVFSTLRNNNFHNTYLLPQERQNRLLLCALLLVFEEEEQEQIHLRNRRFDVAPTIFQTRRQIYDIFDELGPYHMRQAYQMDHDDCFTYLLCMLHPHIVEASKKNRDPEQEYFRKEKCQNGVRHGLISPSS